LLKVNCTLPVSSTKAINQKELETGRQQGPIEKDRRRMLPLPDGHASERKDLIDDRFCILVLLGAGFRLHF
jgi:uncharacterized protein YcbX